MNKFKLIFLILSLVMVGAGSVRADEIKFEASDGLTLAGTWNPVPESKGTAILLHMLDHHRKDWEDFSRLLNENGWNAFSFDLRGHGESLGANPKMDWKIFTREDFRKMTQDLDFAIKFIETKSGSNPGHIFLVGASIGANISAEYVADHPNISGLVLLSPGIDYRGIRPRRALKQYTDRPVLFIVSQEDTFSMTSTDFLYQTVPSPKKALIKLTDKGHGTDMLKADGDLQSKILEFMKAS